MTCKDPDPEDPASLSYAAAGSGFGSIPGKGRFVTELISTFNWRVGVL